MNIFGKSDMLNFVWAVVIVIYSYLESLLKILFPRPKKDLNGKVVLITGKAIQKFIDMK